MAHALMQPGSPGGRSDASTPTQRLMSGVLALSPFKRGGAGTPGSTGNGGPSPYGSDGGASGGTGAGSAPRSLIPSYSHAVQKREVIRQQGEQIEIMRTQLQQQAAELGRLQSALASEREGGASLQERLNMQYFKSSLLVDIMVTRLLEGRHAASAAGAAAADAKAAAAAEGPATSHAPQLASGGGGAGGGGD